MIFPFVGASLCALLLALCYVRKLKICAPPVVTSLVWLIVFAFGGILVDTFYPISIEVFVAWLIWFLIFGFLSFLICLTKNKEKEKEKEKTKIKYLSFNYSFLLFILTIWIIFRIYEIGTSGTEHFFLNLRLSAIGLDGFEPIGLEARAYPIVFALLIYETIYSNNDNKVKRFMCWIWMLSFAILTMGKFSFLTPIAAWCVIKITQGRLSNATIIVIALTTLVLMMVTHFARASDQNLSVFHLLSIYIFSPLVALSHMDTLGGDVIGPYVFRFFYAVGYQLNIVSNYPVSTALEYSYIPYPTNVYTVLHPFLHDFFLPGVFFGALIYLLIYSVLFNFALKNGGIWLAVYAALFISLLTQMFAETLIMNFSGNLQIIICLIVIFMLSKEKKIVS